MLTVTGQNEDISHGLQIGKDQKGDDQRDENGYQINNIVFIDDISIFADTPEGIQKLLNVVQEFTAWCEMQINVKKMYLLVIDNVKKAQRARASVAIDNQRRNFSSDQLKLRVQISGILGHRKRRHESNQGIGQAKEHCST